MSASLNIVKGLAINKELAANKEYVLDPTEKVKIGRDPECEIALRDPLSSRIHATVELCGERWVVRDAGSQNGTQVNGSKIDEASLFSGDRIQIGKTEFLFAENTTLDTATIDEAELAQTLIQNASLILGQTHAKALNFLHDGDHTVRLLDLYQLAYRLLNARTVEDTFAIGVSVIRDCTKADAAGVSWADSSGRLRPQKIGPSFEQRNVQLSRKLTQLVAKDGDAIWFKNENVSNVAVKTFADAIAVPMLLRSDDDKAKVIGAVHVSRANRQFEEHDFEFVISATRLLTAAMLRAEQQSIVEVNRDQLIAKNAHFVELLGESDVMKELKSKIARVGHASGAVLVRGESGSGKELVARAIHSASLRKERPLLCVNCAAIPTELMESQLFGHVKGAFTGADNDHAGWFQQADTGTLFLDELGELNIEGQAKLLRVLEGYPFLPVGSTKEVRVDVRVIAATNRDLKELVAEKKFREDLYYRLSVFELRLPPLRERGSDVEMLISHFFDHFRRQHGRSELTIADSAMKRLVDYHWPGNVRQLRNVIDSAVVMAVGPELQSNDFGLHDVGKNTLDTLQIDVWEERLIREALKRSNSNVNRACEMLGISRATLYRKLDAYGIDRKSL